jgi:ABC-2 type transport system permease protein
MNVPLAFLRRDVLIWTSYRTAVVWPLVGICVFVVSLYFLGGTLEGNPVFIASQSGSFVPFVLSGIAFTDFLTQGMYSPPQAIRENQKDGTLEPMLLTPISTVNLAVSSSLFKLAFAFARTIIYLAFGALVLGFWHHANLFSMLVVLAPATVTYFGLGALSAAFIIILKQGDPVLVAYAGITALIGGAIFPVTALPTWARPIADLFPLTHALVGLRAALEGAPPAQVVAPALVLCAMAVVFLPLGLVAFNLAVNRAKMEGSLAQY